MEVARAVVGRQRRREGAMANEYEWLMVMAVVEALCGCVSRQYLLFRHKKENRGNWDAGMVWHTQKS